MAPEVLARAGEALLYDVKPAGQGMGLGLFLARTVVERLGGAVTFEAPTHPGAPTGPTAPLVVPVGGPDA